MVLGARVYVPALGRWLSPDPAGAGSPYVYVGDNPESDVDPTGEFGFGDLVKVLAVAAAAYYTGGFVLAYGGTAVEAGAAGGFVAGYAGSGGNLEDGAIGALDGAAMGYFGGLSAFGGANPTTSQLVGKGVVEGMVGGTLSAVASDNANGSFVSGFLGAFSAATIGGGIYPNSSAAGVIALRTTAMAVVGGTVSELAGGNFANGAWSAAFQQLFNEAERRLNKTTNKSSFVDHKDHTFPSDEKLAGWLGKDGVAVGYRNLYLRYPYLKIPMLQDPFSYTDQVAHEELFYTDPNGTLHNFGYFEHGGVHSDPYFPKDIRDYEFFPIGHNIRLDLHPTGFGPESYDWLHHNCQDYIQHVLPPRFREY